MTRYAAEAAPRFRVMAPVPEAQLPEAALIWWREFGLRGRVPLVRAGQGAIAVDDRGSVRGVIGFRDREGGFLAELPLAARWLYRAAPPTADLVIDGIVSLDRGVGIGRSLVQAAVARAHARGYPGLRAEVRLRNRGGLAFWRALGFVEIARGRYGWPWSGMVAVMRRDLVALREN